MLQLHSQTLHFDIFSHLVIKNTSMNWLTNHAKRLRNFFFPIFIESTANETKAHIYTKRTPAPTNK